MYICSPFDEYQRVDILFDFVCGMCFYVQIAYTLSEAEATIRFNALVYVSQSALEVQALL